MKKLLIIITFFWISIGYAAVLDQPGLIKQGNSYFSNGQYEDAARSYKKAIEMGESSAAAYNLALTYHHRLNYFNKALYYYELFLKLEPTAKEAPQVKTWIDEVKIKVFPEELVKHPHLKRPSAIDLILKDGITDADINKANEYLSKKNHSQSVSLYKQVLVKSDSPIACYNLALVYDFDLNFTSQAIFYYQKFLSISTDKNLNDKVSQLLADAEKSYQKEKGYFYKGAAFQLRQPK